MTAKSEPKISSDRRSFWFVTIRIMQAFYWCKLLTYFLCIDHAKLLHSISSTHCFTYKYNLTSVNSKCCCYDVWVCCKRFIKLYRTLVNCLDAAQYRSLEPCVSCAAMSHRLCSLTEADKNKIKMQSVQKKISHEWQIILYTDNTDPIRLKLINYKCIQSSTETKELNE